jgi:hypothetical protein
VAFSDIYSSDSALNKLAGGVRLRYVGDKFIAQIFEYDPGGDFAA